MRVISLGWGVQSFALAAMAALGALPPVSAAIHSDTGHERAETYTFAAKWTPWLEKRGVPVVTVQASEHARDICGSGRTPPLFTVSLESGKRGQLYQTCTDRWKIRPMLKWERAQLKKAGGQTVTKLIGITLDEVTRMKRSKNKIEILHYPFIDNFDRPWRRGDAMRFLQDNDLETPVKSSCVFCPWHSPDVWREIKLSNNGDWERALEVDRAIRNRRPGYLCYLTAQRKPLTECDFRSEEDHGQLVLWDAEECTGMCFL